MLAILCVFRFVRLLGSGHQAVVVENLALRLQLAAFKRKRKRPIVTRLGRVFGPGCLGSGVAGGTLWFSFSRIPWCAGSGSVSENSGRYRNPSVAGEEGPVSAPSFVC